MLGTAVREAFETAQQCKCALHRSRMIGTEMAQRILSVWIATEFSEQERHQRRIDLIEDEE